MADVADKININEADIETLAALPGIGLALAERIVAYRQTVHPFEEIMELTAVPGISESMVRAFEEQITLAPEPDILLLNEPSEEPISEPEPAAPVPLPVSTPKPAAARPLPAVETRMMPTAVYIPPPPAISPRRGCLLTVLAVLLGALLGLAATLGILALVNNGTLAFSETDARLSRQLNEAQQAQGNLAEQVTQLNQILSTMATRSGELALEQSQTEANLAASQAELATAQAALRQAEGNIASLNQTAERLDERIDTVAIAAETFNAFLDRLRDLVVELRGTPTAISPTSTQTLVATMTPEAATAVATPTIRLTRTPRPTATPFSQPSSTHPPDWAMAKNMDGLPVTGWKPVLASSRYTPARCWRSIYEGD